MPGYMRDANTGLLVPESLEANPLPGPRDRVEQLWHEAGASRHELVIETIARDGRVRGVVLPGGDDGHVPLRAGLLDGQEIPEGQFVVAAYGGEAVTASLRDRPKYRVPVPPGEMAEIIREFGEADGNTRVVFLVPGLGWRSPWIQPPLHYVQQVATLLGVRASAMIESTVGPGDPGWRLSAAREVFDPLPPVLDRREEAGHLRLVSLPRWVDPPAEPGHQRGPLVAEVVLPAFRDGSLGLRYRNGRAYPVPARVIAAALAPELAGRLLVITTVPLLGGPTRQGTVRQARLAAATEKVRELVARLAAGDSGVVWSRRGEAVIELDSGDDGRASGVILASQREWDTFRAVPAPRVPAGLYAVGAAIVAGEDGRAAGFLLPDFDGSTELRPLGQLPDLLERYGWTGRRPILVLGDSTGYADEGEDQRWEALTGGLAGLAEVAWRERFLPRAGISRGVPGPGPGRGGRGGSALVAG